MISVKTPITREMIDSVFSDQYLCKRFTNPRKDKAICEMRLSGAIYTDIGKRYRKSQTYCLRVVRKAVLLYTVFIKA